MAHLLQTKHRKPRHQDPERHSQAWDPKEHTWEEIASWANRLKGGRTLPECDFHAGHIGPSEAAEWAKTLAWYGLTLTIEGSRAKVCGSLGRSEGLPYTPEGARELIMIVEAAEDAADPDGRLWAGAGEDVQEPGGYWPAEGDQGPAEGSHKPAEGDREPAEGGHKPAESEVAGSGPPKTEDEGLPGVPAPALAAPISATAVPVPAQATAVQDNVAGSDDLLDAILEGL